MQKKISKYFISSFLIIASLNFVLLILIDYLVTLLNPGYTLKLIIFLSFSLILGIILTVSLSVLSPLFNEALKTLRKILHTDNLSNPLLTRLSSEAPGTYHHSLNVSTLAAKAAKAINADIILVRTAAYYHDIGKLNNPVSFVENQSGIEIPTEENPENIKSNAEVIISHVTNGIEIAKANNLPENVIDLIREHHGTTRALYFYQKAKEHGLKIKRTDFRYKGPVPQSKESIILMLADCVEATARSLPHLTKDNIISLVKNTISERKDEKQFKAINLSDEELIKIEDSLIHTLTSIYHQRMVYKDGQFNS